MPDIPVLCHDCATPLIVDVETPGPDQCDACRDRAKKWTEQAHAGVRHEMGNAPRWQR